MQIKRFSNLERDMSLQRRSLALATLAACAIAACASGSAIVTGTPRAPIPLEQVVLYLEPPTEFEVIGLVNASSDAGWTDQQSLDYAIKELRKQAAKLGANGVLIVSSSETTSVIVGGGSAGYAYAVPVTASTVQGKAIFVTKQ